MQKKITILEQCKNLGNKGSKVLRVSKCKKHSSIKGNTA